MHLKAFLGLLIDGFQELRELLVPVSGRHDPMTFPVRTFSAANNVLVPWRLKP
jgi:hypothetical protein